MRNKRVVCKSCGGEFKVLAKHAKFCKGPRSVNIVANLEEKVVVSPEEKAIDVLILYCAEQAEALATISNNLVELKKHVGGGNIEKVWHAEAVSAG